MPPFETRRRHIAVKVNPNDEDENRSMPVVFRGEIEPEPFADPLAHLNVQPMEISDSVWFSSSSAKNKASRVFDSLKIFGLFEITGFVYLFFFISIVLIATLASSGNDHKFVLNYDMKLEDVDDWCVDGGKDCGCLNPLVPSPYPDDEDWNHAHILNVDLASTKRDLDVVFFGDSITEGWIGRSYGKFVSKKEENGHVFHATFSKISGGELEGLPLGISGDTCPNLLWRIQNGELPSTLRPKVFWLLIGTNDLGRMRCSKEIMLLGVINLIQIIQNKAPGVAIVVNAILPRADEGKGGKLGIYWEIIQEVNKKLEEYCKNRSITFVDVGTFFIKQREGYLVNLLGLDGQYIDPHLMGDFLHPTAYGYQMWAERIVEVVKEISP